MIGELVRDLRERRVRIWAEGERLRYEAPRNALTPDLTERMRANKAELIAWCQRARAGRLEPIPIIDRKDPLRLSRGQLRMWFLWMLDPGSTAYCAPVMFKVCGPFDLAVFDTAIRVVRGRHESLRTRFRENDGQPVQVIDDEPFSIDVTDLSNRPAAEAAAIAADRMNARLSVPMDLKEKPPFEVHVFRINDERHDVLIRLHHIIYDGWSNHLFLTELWAAYRELADGVLADLPPLSVQYADFAAWQHTRLSSDAIKQLIAFWTGQLDGAASTIRLPVRPDPPAEPLADVDSVRLLICQETTSRLEALCRKTAATLFMLLAAALRILLARYSGADDFIIGTPSMRRVHPDTEKLIGYFGNTLLLRNPVSPTHTFREVLVRERETALAAYQHQELPFDMLVEALAPHRTDAEAPLFQVIVLFGEKAPGTLSVGNLKVNYLEEPPTGSKTDLGLWIKHAPQGGLSGHFEFAPRRFERGIVEGLARHFQTILDAMATDPDSAIGTTQLLDPAELDKVLRTWNGPAWTAQSDLIPRMIRARVSEKPETVAIRYDGRETTYRDLDRSARALAAHLRRLGVTPGELVLVCLPREPTLVASLIAVLGVGGVYVPVDPKYPPERRRTVLENSGARFVIATGDQARGELWSGTAVLDSSDVRLEDAEDWGAAIDALSPDDLSWVLYTSGSTGRPKGVEIRHGGAAALIAWAHQTFSGTELTGVLAGTSVCFDLSVFELFAPLCGGHTVILAESPLDLFNLPDRDRVTLLNTVPSVMRVLLSSEGGRFPAALQTVCLAGEPLGTPLVNEVYQRTGIAKVYDLYGPTEATTYATCKLREPSARPTIGRAIAGTRTYVLDRCGMPLPPGVIGELHLAGDALARGYLGRPDLTGERFGPPKAECISEIRLYRTGDLVRFTADGDLEYLGRSDDQLKIRGYRIEPGEVRAALLALDGVDDAVVTGLPDERGGLRLAAYVIGSQDATETAALRRRLAAVLPDFMIPSVVTRIDRFPLTPNGKVDLAGLRPANRPAATADLTPLTENEKVIAGIWQDLLGRPVGRQDHFFDVGGTSMSAMLLVGRINARFGTQMPLRTLFEQPTLEALARQVDEVPRQARIVEEATYQNSDVPMTLLQRHLWLVHRSVDNAAFLNLWQTMPLSGPMDRAALGRALEEVLRRHPILGARFRLFGLRILQSYEDIALTPDTLDLLHIGDAKERQRRFDNFCHQLGAPFDLEEGPCLRLGLVELTPERQLVLIIVHHIIVDEWSLAGLSKEIRERYVALRDGGPAPARKAPIPFADHAVWERRCRADGRFDEDMAAWVDNLKRPLARLPLDWARPGDPLTSETYRFPIPSDLWQRLKCVATNERCSLFVVTLSMLMLLLRRETREPDIRVCTNVSRRHQHDFEDTIGPLTDTLILRGHLLEDGTRSALQTARASLLEAYKFLAIPFEEMASRLTREHGISRRELAQLFFLLNEEDTPAIARSDGEIPPLRMSPDFFSAADHAYDLVLYISRLDGIVEGHLTLRGAGREVHEKVAADYIGLLNELASTEG
ncbi:amino acid adenylation domain-containing protein [Bradyrhizobium sp. AUGA SZCCT0274]|uniref:non-ribosomal peptide synthetase n=1 Tax=Bradyrhizobium sp. AUGA SZCCT0274 TaxID=2807670 RepID=UPI001BAB4AE6|nr:non-ribosomal peptide synthetase [Bradyrhizobium sp. AUGA SZCCT0274]MBR1240330.1 amino acid adenylation domain-containing protein [Bradyrhizobium sp. AUGA SZCCT0274]